MRKPHSPAALSQVDKFRKLAGELECGDDEKAFDEKLKRIAIAPKPRPEDAD
jgi:hypothetical protein